MALAWVHQNRDHFEEPFEAVDLIYADFGYPEEVGDFATFTSPPAGGTPGISGLEQRWQQYLDKNRDHYLRRASKSAQGSSQ